MSQAMEPFITKRKTWKGQEWVPLAEFTGVVDRMAAEAKELREQDEVHWKTRQHLVAEVERLQAENAEQIAKGLTLAGQVEDLLAVLKKHYPAIAGHVSRLQDAHEDRAAGEWLGIARDFYDAIAHVEGAPVVSIEDYRS
jgi:hypothetical protein